MLVGMQCGTATLEDSLVVSYKTKHTVTFQHPAIDILGIYPKELKIHVHTKMLHMDFYSKDNTFLFFRSHVVWMVLGGTNLELSEI